MKTAKSQGQALKQVITTEQLNQEQELQKSLDKIVSNVDASGQALVTHLEHVNELKSMIETQDDGPAKEELVKVLNHAEKHVSDLQDHIKFGHKLVAQKESKLFELQKKINHKLDKAKVFIEYKMPEPFTPKQIVQKTSENQVDQ